MIYVYPKFPAAYNLYYLRIGGSGLANCLFVYARSIALASYYNAKIIKPAWFNISIGTYIRNEADKRHYLGLFSGIDEVSGLEKTIAFLRCKVVKEGDTFNQNDNIIIVVEGLKDYFKSIIPHHKVIKSYIEKHIVNKNLLVINSFDFTNCVAIHVRLGDYGKERRVPLSWYKDIIEKYHKENPESKMLLFSDGTDEELKDILALVFVKRVYFGSSISDIIAISKCNYLIGSDSTFSAWGAYLGQVPLCCKKLQCSPVLENQENERIG